MCKRYDLLKTKKRKIYRHCGPPALSESALLPLSLRTKDEPPRLERDGGKSSHHGQMKKQKVWLERVELKSVIHGSLLKGNSVK